MADKFFHFAKWIYIVGNVGRIFLVLASLKYPVICNLYLSYDWIISFSDVCMV